MAASMMQKKVADRETEKEREDEGTKRHQKD